MNTKTLYSRPLFRKKWHCGTAKWKTNKTYYCIFLETHRVVGLYIFPYWIGWTISKCNIWN